MAKRRRPRPTRPPKDPDVVGKVRRAVSSGSYTELRTDHATDRQSERRVTRPEYVYVLKNGYHEKSKDEFKEEFQAWNYAIRGKTIDGRDLRVPVSFDKDGTLLIITLIDLDQP